MKNYFDDWNLFEKIWLGAFTLLGICLSYAWGESPIGLIAFLTGIWCVILVTKGKISNYYFGLVNCVAYGYVAYTRALYGETMLNWGYFFPAQLIGWWLWTKASNRQAQDKSVIIAKTLKSHELYGTMLATAMSIIAYGFILKVIKGNLPWLDATTTILQVSGMILMALRYKEQWIMWIIVDVLQILLWAIVLFKQGANDISALMMWSAFLINAIYGYYKWNKMAEDKQYV